MLTNPKALWHAEPPHRLVLFGVWQGMSCTIDNTWAWHNIWRNAKGVKRGENVDILTSLSVFFTHGHHKIGKKFDSHPLGAVPLIIAWHEGERMKRNWPEAVLLAATGFAWLVLSVKFSSLSLSHVWQLSMELHLVVMNHTFIKSHGVQESIKTLKKKSKCQYFHLFLLL